MKINLDSIDRESFQVKPVMVGDEEVYLVNPVFVGCKWTADNLIYRSSVWNKDGCPVSLSYPKFFNFLEKPDIHPFPDSINNVSIVEKIDGSTLIFSCYKGRIIARTRGTIDATKIDNGYEVPILMDKYKSFLDWAFMENLGGGYSWIMEWVTPTNKIVLSYPEPELILTGRVEHQTYRLTMQDELDAIAKEHGLKRPERHFYHNTEALLADVKQWKGKEGVCVYYNNDRWIRKVKAESYLTLHALKSNLTTEKLADLWFSYGQPDYEKFSEKFEEAYDHECWLFARPAISALFDGIREYRKIMEAIQNKVLERKAWARKDFAIKAREEYGATRKFTVAMETYLGKQPKHDVVKGLLLQNSKQVELKMFGNNSDALEDDAT